MARNLILHGHFYQPPRENPWLGSAEKVDTHSARTIKGFNDLVDLQCYTPNSLAYVFKKDTVRLVNNYAYLSFNMGPTLLDWLERYNFSTYQRIIQGDFESQQRLDGHGNAIAQVYNHTIMPLASRRDKLTQIYWGIHAFEKAFSRPPEGMWLAEAAIDTETVDCLVEAGLKFTVTAARAARRIRPLGGGPWQEVDENSFDIGCPYLVKTPEGDLSVFFFDPFYYEHIGGMLKSTDLFLNSLDQRYPDRDEDRGIGICTDGELYGHWEPFGERFLAWLLSEECSRRNIHVSNFGYYLAGHPPEFEVELIEAASWSCPHGVERWRANCGCSDEQPGLQQYRAPLRKALNRLADDLYTIYFDQTKAYLKDPLEARHDYLHVTSGDDASEIAFLNTHLKEDVKPLSVGVRQVIINLLESQRFAQMMFTSCGWFFWDISRPEPLKNLQYAARAVEHLNGTHLIEQVEQPFLHILEEAPSNTIQGLTARDLYLREARYTAPKYQQEIEEVGYSGGVLLKIPFDLMGNVSERFQWKLRSIVAAGASELTLDFGEVDHIDNYGLSAIMAVYPTLKNRGGRVLIYRARDNIIELLRAARLTEVLEITGEDINFKENQ